MRTTIPIACCVLLVGCTGDVPAVRVEPPPAAPVGDAVPLPDDPRRQFDFWVGAWDVRNLRLRGGEWTHVGDAAADVWSVADGRAVLEQWNGTLDGAPLIGFSLRAWDPELDAWSVWLNWHGGRPDGFSEMRGRRNGERIEQFPPGNTEGVRYRFSEIHEGSCRWDQAQPRGDEWLENWIMRFTRRGPALAVDASNAPIVRPPETPAEFEKTRRLDHLIGIREGPATFDDGSGGTVAIRVSSMLEGFGLLQFVDIAAGGTVVERTLTAMGWDRNARGWVALHIDGRSTYAIRKLLIEPGSTPDDLAFASAEAPWLLERWRCRSDGACSWRRERSYDDGTTWVPEVSAELGPPRTE